MSSMQAPVILLSMSEYKRLLAIEKKDRGHSENKKHASGAATVVSDSENSATHLAGQGALLTGIPNVPGLQNSIKRSVPAQIDTPDPNLPPPNVPVFFNSSVHQNPELVKQLVQMEKHLKAPTGLPLNDPSGAADPKLQPGDAPSHPFQEPKKARVETEHERQEVAAWYFVGLDFESDSGDSD